MRKIAAPLALALLCSFASTAGADERNRWWNVFVDESAAVVTLAGNTSVHPREQLGIEANFPFGLTLGNDFTYYSAGFGAGTVQRSSLGFRLGWNFFERRLQLVSRYDAVSTSYSNYNSSSSDGAGVEALFKMPLDQNHRFFLNLGGGWAYVGQVTLDRDTGQPAVSGDFGNALCSIFTIGLSSGCGNIFEHVTIPRSTFWHLGAGVGWVW
jgi:hypothetical protein